MNSNILIGVIGLVLIVWIWITLEIFNAPLVDENENLIEEDDINLNDKWDEEA